MKINCLGEGENYNKEADKSFSNEPTKNMSNKRKTKTTQIKKYALVLSEFLQLSFRIRPDSYFGPRVDLIISIVLFWIKELNNELSRKLEAQTQRLEFLTAQSMASDHAPAKQPDVHTSYDNAPYADEGDEVTSMFSFHFD